MRTLIIDGYNVIYAIPELEELLGESLEAARAGLVRLLTRAKDSRRDIERLYVVFDGRADDDDGESTVAPGITAIYTQRKKDADQKIVEMVRDAARADAITVVSNDNFLYNNVRAHGAYVEGVEEFCRRYKV